MCSPIFENLKNGLNGIKNFCIIQYLEGNGGDAREKFSSSAIAVQKTQYSKIRVEINEANNHFKF